MTSNEVVAETSAWQRYRETGSEDAFREVVERHINLVYSVAIRRTRGDPGLAEDIVQKVFADLSQKAATLAPTLILPGWLYRHASFVAASVIRGENRRRQREVAAMNQSPSSDPIHWTQIQPVLDEALGELPERDRTAIILRFLDQQPFAEVGRLLGIGSDAARMRVDRALSRLRDGLERRGIHSTAAALALGMGQHGVVAAPALLAASIAAAATLTTSTVATATAFGFMSTSKIPIGLAALVAAASTTVAYLQHRENAGLRGELAAARASLVTRDTAAEPNGAPDPAEWQSLREDRVRLMALRDEVTRLRESQQRMAALEEENRLLREQSGSQAENATAEKERDFEAELQTGLALARMNFAQSWMLAFMLYAEDNSGQIPSAFDQATKYYSPNERSGGSLLDPARFEIVYQGAWSNIANPASTIVIREREPFTMKRPDGTERLARTYGFADGHSEIYAAPTGTFDEWERKRMIPPPAAE